jgi:hypothetical protein
VLKARSLQQERLHLSHPNVDLAKELRKCVKAPDASSVEAIAIPGKRKGFLIINSEGRYELTGKGNEFMAKWFPHN